MADIVVSVDRDGNAVSRHPLDKQDKREQARILADHYDERAARVEIYARQVEETGQLDFAAAERERQEQLRQERRYRRRPLITFGDSNDEPRDVAD